MSDTARVKGPDTPECDRLLQLTDKMRTIQDFLECLQSLVRSISTHDVSIVDVEIESLLVCLDSSSWDKELIKEFWEWLSQYERYVTDIRIEHTLYEYYGIDRNELERERREILAGCRAGNALHDARKELGLDG